MTEQDDAGVDRSDPIEPSGDWYPPHPGGEPVILRLSAIQNDVLIHLIEEFEQELPAKTRIVFDDIIEKLDTYGYRHRDPPPEVAEELKARLRDTTDQVGGPDAE